MPEVDFLTNVESAFLKLFTNNPLLNEYSWARWDSDEEMKLPAATLGLRARRDPDETPYHRVDVSLRLEGRPKKQKLSTVMNEIITVLKTTQPQQLSELSDGMVSFIGKAITVGEDRPIRSGLRSWTLDFAIYALPMN